jgi:hypothetical protein
MNDFDILLDEVQRLPVSDHARAEFLGLLSRMAGRTVHIKRVSIVIPPRVELAKKMLQQGMAVSSIRTALMERTQVSRASAYRLIALALNTRIPKADHG